MFPAQRALLRHLGRLRSRSVGSMRRSVRPPLPPPPAAHVRIPPPLPQSCLLPLLQPRTARLRFSSPHLGGSALHSSKVRSPCQPCLQRTMLAHPFPSALCAISLSRPHAGEHDAH